LLGQLQDQAQFTLQACDGLALAIENSTRLSEGAQATKDIAQLLLQYTQRMGEFGPCSGQMDTLVLGCTHYVFAQEALRALLGPQVKLVSTGEPVARQTRRLLESARLLRSGPSPHALSARIRLMGNGDLAGLQAAAQRWLQLPHTACHRADLHV
jgi:glutamate racemase